MKKIINVTCSYYLNLITHLLIKFSKYILRINIIVLTKVRENLLSERVLKSSLMIMVGGAQGTSRCAAKMGLMDLVKMRRKL